MSLLTCLYVYGDKKSLRDNLWTCEHEWLL